MTAIPSRALQEKLSAEAQHVIDCCRHLARFSEDATTITRRFLTPPTREVHQFLRAWMERLGMQVTLDAAGNLRGLYPAPQPEAPRLLIGSHIDTVPDAGAFDGVLGVVLALALIEALEGRRLGYAIEVLAFSEEEGVRFDVPFLGSLAVIGALDAPLLARTDSAGITVEQAIRDFNLDPAQLPEALLSAAAFAYLEFHIEQGPILESLGLSLGVVEALAGQSRFDVIFRGKANHAGTTPMNLRHDALAGAAEWILAVEREARSTVGLVATTGQIAAQPGAANVIPGEVTLSLDIRHARDAVRAHAVESLSSRAHEIANGRGLCVSIAPRLDQPAVPMDATLAALLESAVATAGYGSQRMVSGAGHDAMILARKLPAIMLFLRSPGGISHHPDEDVRSEDVQAALSASLHFLDLLEDRLEGCGSRAS